jgi:hypothetical protein
MADPTIPPETGATDVGPGPGPSTGMPRWVKVFLVVALAVVVLLVIVLLFGGEHGPRLH